LFTWESGSNIIHQSGIYGEINISGSISTYSDISDNDTVSIAISDNIISFNNGFVNESDQENATRSDINYDIQISEHALLAVSVIRGPYLQKGTSTSMVVRWRTATATESVIDYGTTLGNLNQKISDLTTKTEHEIEITGLVANTVYYYRISDSSEVLIPEASDMYFKTHPIAGSSQPFTFWVLGDPGTADENQRAVRDAFYDYIGTDVIDGILFLGDNAYEDGTDSEFQSALFDIYDQRLKNSIAWLSYGNHDGHLADAESQTGPYFDIFTFPKSGESGGMPSGTEAYYSFDYGNVHFIVLESYETDRSIGGDMYNWAVSDIQNTMQDWIIAFWHHPPYSKGSHDSDTESRLEEMRENFLPMLENYGVDLVLAGHSHSYERSFFLNSHYSTSDTFDSTTHTIGNNGYGDGQIDGAGAYEKTTSGADAGKGAVYVVAGSSGKLANVSNHNAMAVSLNQLGSCVIEVDSYELHVKFISETGAINDYFTIQKECIAEGCNERPSPPDTIISYHDSLTQNSFYFSWESVSYADGYYVDISSDTFKTFTNGNHNLLVNDTILSVDNLESGKAYQIRVKSYNEYGESEFSDTVEIITCYPKISDINLSITDECNASGNGHIQINLEGGESPIFTSFNNISFDTLLTYSNLNEGNYDLYITDMNRCESLRDTINISFNISNLTVPKPEIILNGNQNICLGEQTELMTNGIYDFYYWTNLDYEELSDSSKMITSTEGYYYLEATLYGCKSRSDTIFINTMDTYQEQQICVVTVDQVKEKNKITWSKRPDNFINQINIYKEIGTDVYNPIGLIDYDSINFFIDNDSNPVQASERYKISITDECGIESGLSYSHKTIYLQASLGLNNTVNLQWSNYEGFAYSQINILRGSSYDSLELLTTRPANNDTYTDTSPDPDEILYVIEAIAEYTCEDGITGGRTMETYAFTRSNVSNITMTTSLEDELLTLIKLFPNPSDGIMRVEVPKEFGIYDLFIINMNGQIIYYRENLLSNVELDISGIPDGKYLLYLKDFKYSIRFIKE
jgi:hypothetical protein